MSSLETGNSFQGIGGIKTLSAIQFQLSEIALEDEGDIKFHIHINMFYFMHVTAPFKVRKIENDLKAIQYTEFRLPINFRAKIRR